MDRSRAVLFDMDGVLVLSGPAHWLAWREATGRRGIELTHEQFLSFNGFTNRDICARLWGEAATPAFVDEVAEHKEGAFRDAIRSCVPLAPGCRELLANLRRLGASIAVGSSAPQGNVDLVLDGGGIRPYFQAVVHAGMVARGKPAPDIFLRAAELLEVAPACCLVVEDAPSGVRAAIAAGMQVVGVLTNHAAAELLDEGAGRVVESLLDLDAASLLG